MEKEKSVLKQKGLHKGILLAVAVILILTVIALLAVFAPGRATAKKVAEKLSLGERYLSELDYEQAIAAYQAAIEIDPKCEEAYLALADIYMEIGEFDLAEEILEEAEEALGSETEEIWKKKEDLEDAIQYAKEHPTPKPEPTVEPNSEPTSTEATTVAPTAEGTPTATPEATATPTAKPTSIPTSMPNPGIGSVSVGDIVTFGHYEQDNDLTNGAEAIEWLVLDVQDGRALLLSKYGLDCKQYNEEDVEVTWETCTLRSWLNEEFYKLAFNEAEQALIPTVTVTNLDNPYWETDGGNDTNDKVFLLSTEEVYEYFPEDTVDSEGRPRNKDRATKATAYAIEQGAWVYSEAEYGWYGTTEYDGNSYWWLLSPGYSQYVASIVDATGFFEAGSYRNVLNDDNAVRPALWVNLDGTATPAPTAKPTAEVTPTAAPELTPTPKPTATPTAKPTTTPNPGIGSVSVGDIVTFGSYEQDNDLTNGAEAIEWLVLDVQDGKALLLSKYALDAKPYHEEWEAVTWETCTLRSWLNEEFYKLAFDEIEQTLIPNVMIMNPADSEWGIAAGNDTEDRIFLLSIDEVNTYFQENDRDKSKKLATRDTAYAIAQGVSYSKYWEGNCIWWLRAQSNDSALAFVVYYDGEIYHPGDFYNSGDLYGIRPALWVNLDDTATDVPTATPTAKPTTTPNPGIGSASVGDIVTFGSYEQDNNLTNGAEAIEWLVLDVQDGKALLLSRYGLDAKPYHEEYADITWETCTLRSWLNGEFYSQAFDETERTYIPIVTITNPDNLYMGTVGENDIEDKVFLLSIEEAYMYFPEDTVDSNGYWINKERATKPTAYAIAQGAWYTDGYDDWYDGNCYWWLRSRGHNQYIAFVDDGGYVYDRGGFGVSSENSAVRPALWVNLNP